MEEVDDHTVNIMDVNLARAPVPATNDNLVRCYLYAKDEKDHILIEICAGLHNARSRLP